MIVGLGEPMLAHGSVIVSPILATVSSGLVTICTLAVRKRREKKENDLAVENKITKIGNVTFQGDIATNNGFKKRK